MHSAVEFAIAKDMAGINTTRKAATGDGGNRLLGRKYFLWNAYARDGQQSCHTQVFDMC